MTKNDVNYNLIGQRIKELRKEKNLSQMELAEKADLAVQYISNVETATRKASLAALVSIANAMNVGMDDLLIGILIYDKRMYKDDADVILDDCSLYEKRVISRVMSATKESLRLSAGLNGAPRNKIFK